MSDTVTIVFTDLVGSTALAASLGDDANDEMRRRHFAALLEAITATNGDFVKNLGDGVMAAYASAADAVAGAIAMQRAVDRDNRVARGALAIRVGISSGDAGREDGDWFGAPVVEAARLCADAEGGQILANDVVRLLAGSRGGHLYRRLGPRALKGIPGDIDVCEVEWLQEAAERVPLPPALAAVESVPLVGRDEPFALLVDHLTKVSAGARSAVFLGGEPGIGKTRLAAEFSKRAESDGALVLFGRCDEEPLSPYQPFLEAFGYYARHASASDLRAAAGRHAAVLARFVPDIGDRVPGLPTPPSADPDSDRFRLFEAVATLLRSLGNAHPVVFVMDDIHWADKPTLLLLRHLLRHADALRLLVVGTYRDTELGRAHPLSETFADLRRDGFDERVSLRGLVEADIESLVAGAAGHELDDDARSLVRALHDVTEGSPFFLREVLRHLIEIGVLSQADGAWTVQRLITRAGLPEGVKEVIGRRLSRLSERTNDVLRAASVIGREFDVTLLSRVLGLREDEVLDSLEEGLGARLVSETGVVDRFAFGHALVREALHGELSSARRIRLHERVGRALEALHADDIDGYLSQLAYHYGEAAGGVAATDAVDYSRRAARRAMSLYAYEEAAGYLESAIEVLSTDPDAPVGLRIDVLLELGEAQRSSSGWSGTPSFQAALELARTHGDAERIGRAVMGMTGWYSFPGRPDPEAVELLEEALAGGLDDQPALRAWLLARLGLALYYAGTIERSREVMAEALALARQAGDQRTLAYTLWAWRWHLMASADIDARLRLADEGEAAARAANDGWLLAGAHAWRIADLYAAGDIAAVRAAIADYHNLADQIRVGAAYYYVSLFEGALAISEGRLDEGEALINEALGLGQELSDPIVMNQYAAQLFALRLEQDRLDEILPLIELRAEIEPGIPWQATTALIHAWQRDHERTVEILRTYVTPGLPLIPRDGNWPIVIAVLAFAAALVDDPVSAEILLPLTVEYDNVRIVIGVFSAVATNGSSATGALEYALGRYDEAERHLLAGLASDDAVGCRVWASKNEYSLARLYAKWGRPGDRERAQTHAARARAIATDIGQPGVLRLVDELGL